MANEEKPTYKELLAALVKARAEREPSYKNLFTALAKAQAELPTALKKSAGFKYKYADLTETVKVSRPILTKHGLSVTQVIIEKEDAEFPILRTILGHTSGEFLPSEIRIDHTDTSNKLTNKQQALGGALTHLRRYTYAAIIGIVSDDDDDAASFGDNGNTNTYSNKTY